MVNWSDCSKIELTQRLECARSDTNWYVLTWNLLDINIYLGAANSCQEHVFWPRCSSSAATLGSWSGRPTKLLPPCQAADCTFKVDGCWVTTPDDFAIHIDKDAVGNASDTPVLRSSWTTFVVVVGYIVPSFGVNMWDHSGIVVIDAESDDLDVLPVTHGSVIFYHLRVVGHWRLARWTPCGPEVKQVNVAIFMS